MKNKIFQFLKFYNFTKSFEKKTSGKIFKKISLFLFTSTGKKTKTKTKKITKFSESPECLEASLNLIRLKKKKQSTNFFYWFQNEF